MKYSLIACVLLFGSIATPALADGTAAPGSPQKTTMATKSHPECNTSAGKSRKDCVQTNAGAQPSH